MTTEYSADQIKELEARASKLEALEKQLATMERSAQVASVFGRLKDKAVALVAAGKLPPAEFKAFGFDESQASIAKFSAGDDLELAKLEIELNAIEKYATPVKMGLTLDAEPLPGDDSSEIDRQVAAFNKSYMAKASYQ